MNAHPEIEGVEFDWYATDRSGNFAGFATAGAGFVLPCVVLARLEQCAISEGFDNPHWGSEKVWDYYSSSGLYVLDWATSGSSYQLVRTPTSDIGSELRLKLVKLLHLPKLNTEFQNCSRISGAELAKATFHDTL